MTITTDINSSGLQPVAPTVLRDQLIALVAASNPGYTANLPGSLIEDISSTDVGALSLIDAARVELFNSITPYGANSFLLNQLGQIYGVQQGVGSNTSVYVTFSGSPGFVISPGFTVSDGGHQYTVQDGGVIGTPPGGSSVGQSAALYCLATVQGSWAVPEGTVTALITSVPSGVTLTCTNLTPGLPGAAAQTLQAYQAQVIQAGLAGAQGMPNFLRTQLGRAAGVQPRLVSVRASGSKWEIICGGGDPYAVANAIFTGLFDISNLTGSVMSVANLTAAYPAVMTTVLNHGYTTGQVVQCTGLVGMTGINGVNFTAVVLTEKTFSLAVPITSIAWATGVATVTTASPHGLPAGTSAGHIYGVTPVGYNGAFTFTKTGANTFTYPLAINPGAVTVQGYTDYDSVGTGTYSSGGVLTPNLRNVTVSINDYPDLYSITFVNPPVQSVAIAITWNTIATNFVSASAVAQLTTPAIVAYINSIPVGQPINTYELQDAFQNAVEPIIPAELVSKIDYSVLINGIATYPISGTLLIYGDPESYFLTSDSLVTVVQG